MTQGISQSLNSMLARLNVIESNFSALENIQSPFNVQKTSIEEVQSNSDSFKSILSRKMENSDLIKKPETKPLKNIEEPVSIEPEEILPDVKKEAINLKSKIDIKSQSSDIDEIIETISNKYGVDSDFIKALIKQESGFNTKATSKKGAMGLMQLMPSTAKALGVTDAYNPLQNIEGGVKHISNLLKKYNNDEKLALAAYNAGSGAVKKYGGIPPYKETQNYVKSIMANYDKIKEAKL